MASLRTLKISVEATSPDTSKVSNNTLDVTKKVTIPFINPYPQLVATAPLSNCEY
jgi:hypothetical protein